jgi:tetratricopeptide (TPR) repeat protein
MADEPFCLYVVGRLRGVTRTRLVAAAAAAGGRLVGKPSSRVTLVALGHSSAPATLVGGAIRLPKTLAGDVELVSEMGTRRRLGLAPPAPDSQRQHSMSDLSRASGLDPDTIRALALYDVLDREGGRFGFRDVLAAREARRLLDRGLPLAAIVEAALALRRNGRGLFDTALSDAPWGEILQQSTGRLGRLDGQYLLPLEEDFLSADELFERGEAYEYAGVLDQAERFYRLAQTADRTDPVIPFNLGNVLDLLARPGEAAIAYQQALGRDPAFAEAWVNLAGLHERAGRFRKAVECLGRAVQARPGYAEALFSLASLLMRQESYREALSLWDRYVALEPRPSETEKARRFRWLCRLAASAPRALGEQRASLASGDAPAG